MAYSLYKYDKEVFADIIMSANFFINRDHLIKQPSFLYLHSYLKRLKCEYIIEETYYISETFSQEFEYYYSTEFKNISKYTTRIHFLSTIENFEGGTMHDFSQCKGDLVNEAYLGFIVIKPVPNAFWGVTMLKLYEASETRRYNSVVEDVVHISNHELFIKTLPFQPQDNTISECATTSIWSTFYYAHKSYRLPYLSVASISKLIRDKTPYTDGFKESPLFLGLSAPQIHKVITEYGLLTHSYPLYTADTLIPNVFKSDLAFSSTQNILQNEDIMTKFKNIIFSFSCAGFPILLGYKIFNHSKDQFPLHLVAVTGFKLKEDNDEKIYFSENITSLYAHDDQFGPFSRIDFFQQDDLNSGQQIEALKTQFLRIKSEPDESKSEIPSSILDKYTTAIPTNIYIATPNKLRLSYSGVVRIQNSFINILNVLYDIGKDRLDDVNCFFRKMYVEKGSKYKSRIAHKYKNDNRRVFEEINSSSFPEYVWIVNVYTKNEVVCDLILDSSCILESFCYIQLIFFQDNWNQLRKLNNSTTESFLDSIADTFTDDINGEYINRTYINHLMAFIKYQISPEFSSENVNEVYSEINGLKKLKF